MKFTHLNADGNAVMVDVGDKSVTERTAAAKASLFMHEKTLKAIKDSELKKGDALAVSRIAGVMGGKRTHELIPLCHNIPIDKIEIDFSDNGKDELYIFARAKCTYKTGIEMEVLTAVSIAALTVYDMCKAVDRGMVIKEIKLLEKTGGKSDYKNEG
ncbi:MAG: cyclic pyranopterin monophosphate synthase MoaC [Ruminococcaceae bacterium]|nr:cyclic pyranopterin monophosphate synthase MoaC [Oscillospiraceae bacterium]MBR3595406.1 cyclic pyranopterin monophosphate synthase MoaC [Clostridia bacterium]